MRGQGDHAAEPRQDGARLTALGPLLLFLAASLLSPLAEATSCRVVTCSNNGECINVNDTSLGCSCDLNGDAYGKYCNQTSLECALDRCQGRGTCLVHLQECVCGLTRYNGQTGCSTCITGFDLATNCTNCSSGWFGSACSLTAAECGLERCNARGLCTDTGGCLCYGTLFFNLTNCTSHSCGSAGFPSIESGFTQCACRPGFVGTPCTRACGAHGYSPDNEVCVCTDSYAGVNCDTPPIDCVHGTLLNNSYCQCDELFGGTLCDQPLANCSGHGTAVSATLCVCSGGWAGELCDLAPLSIPESDVGSWGVVVGSAMGSLLVFVGVLAYAMRGHSVAVPLAVPVESAVEETSPLVKRRGRKWKDPRGGSTTAE